MPVCQMNTKKAVGRSNSDTESDSFEISSSDLKEKAYQGKISQSSL